MATHQNSTQASVLPSAATSPAASNRAQAAEEAKQFLPLFEGLYPSDQRPRRALDAAISGRGIARAHASAVKAMESAARKFEQCTGSPARVRAHCVAADVAEAAALCCAPNVNFHELEEALSAARQAI